MPGSLIDPFKTLREKLPTADELRTDVENVFLGGLENAKKRVNLRT